MRRHMYSTVLVATLLAIVVPATSAQAQIGRLKRIGADMVKDAAGVPASPKAAAANDITVTPERLAAIIAVLEPRISAARTEHEARAAEKEFETWTRTFNSCVENAAKGVTIPSSEGMEASIEITGRMNPLLERMGKYAAAQDKRPLEYVQDSLRVLSAQSQIAMFGATKCGKPRYTPTPILEAKIARESRKNTVVDESGVRWDLDVPADKRAGMTHYQFGVIRERMALWGLMQQGVLQPDRAGKLGVFTDAERAALTARNSEIDILTTLFRSGALRWTNWGDITAW